MKKWSWSLSIPSEKETHEFDLPALLVLPVPETDKEWWQKKKKGKKNIDRVNVKTQ